MEFYPQSDRKSRGGTMALTSRRIERMRELLARKQPCLKLLLENVHDSHNISAVMRSADAVGVLDFYYSLPLEGHVKTHRTITQGAHRWLRKERIPTDRRLEFLRKRKDEGYQVVVTELSEESVDFRAIDYTLPTLLVFGNEKEGVTPEVSAEATRRVVIPMHGMVQSLNVSVAAALILYEAERQRAAAGYYESQRLDETTAEALLAEWIHRDAVLRKSRGRIGI
jgi:tRNA (guanosine-2'-O-)-methyltransferase